MIQGTNGVHLLLAVTICVAEFYSFTSCVHPN